MTIIQIHIRAGRHELVSQEELCASASFLGAAVFYLVIFVTNDVYAGTISGLLLATGLRMVAMKYNWNLPKVKSG